MVMRFNDAVVGAIIKADARGASANEMRDLYIQRNAFEVDLDVPVYRIVEFQYLLEDLSDKCLSYTKIDKTNWGDSSENPLLDRTFPDAVTGSTFTLNGVVSAVYGSCWSATALDTLDQWAIFSRRNPSVRLQSTPRKLLHAAMSSDNRFYMLQHTIGKMRYAKDAEIVADFSDPDWQKHLDGLGQGSAASFLILSETLSSEDEVRLIYDHLAGDWSKANVQIVDRFAKVPFDWSVAIDSIVVGPFVSDGGEGAIRKKVQSLGLNCSVTSSRARTSVG